MHNSCPQPINNLFHKKNTGPNGCVFLLRIQKKALMLMKLNQAVSELLPTTLRPWCRVANFHRSIIVLETVNAIWIARLRYEQDQLVSTLRTHILPSLSSIDIRINPAMTIKTKEKLNVQGYNHAQDTQLIVGNPRKLSKQSAVLLRHVAVHSEGKLKKTLERLAGLSKNDTVSAPSYRE